MKRNLFFCFVFCLFSGSVLLADGIEYRAGYEKIPGKYYSPQYKALWSGKTDWAGNPAWTLESSTPTQYKKDVDFSVLFVKVSKTKQILSAGFETGIGFYQNGFLNEWSIAGGISTNTALTSEYPTQYPGGWMTPADDYSWFYKKEMDVWFIPVLAKFAFEVPLEIKIRPFAELNIGVYMIGQRAVESEGKKYVKDSGNYKEGDVDIDTDRWNGSPVWDIRPTLQFSAGLNYEIVENLNFGLNFGVGWLRTEKEYG